MASSSSMKRLPSTSDDQKGAVAKKRRRKPSISEEEDTRGSSSLPKYLAEPPMSKIYNSSFRNNKPAELFRKDLISAMKLPDSEQLCPEDYWLLSDSWKQEWERGVQVPVNPEALPEPNVRVIRKKDKAADFKLPKKYIRCTHDEFFSNDFHTLVNVSAQAEKMCRYDLDDIDVHWLKLLNEEREDMVCRNINSYEKENREGAKENLVVQNDPSIIKSRLPVIEESDMERIMEELETQCFENLQEAIKKEKGVGIEYDEDVICDVCRSPDSEEGNEMVFCDSCNICVHQACYGITTIPEGSWLCCTCAFGIKPSCILCPNRGGAMKSTRSGQKWAHVSCALWIPEVSIGCVEKMEPITKISQIPASRWALVCSVCRERVGACIQCSVKTCKIAYHVTCAFKDGLAMKAIIDEENDEDGVKLRSYCEKHSKRKQLDESSDSDCGDGGGRRSKKKVKSKKKLEISSEDNLSVRKQKGEKCSLNSSISQKRLCQLESTFYNYVNIKEAAELLQVDPTVVDFVFQYWKLKRLANFNKPLIVPKADESDSLGKQQEDSLYARMKMFVHLRQDLERVRNLCYMVSRREKLSRSWYRIKQEIFFKQVEVIMDSKQHLTEKELEAVIHANHGDSIYDQLFTWNTDITPSLSSLLSILDGSNVNADLHAGVNKLSKRQQQHPHQHHQQQQQQQQRPPNPYAKHYLNGMLSRSQRRISSMLPLSRETSMSGDSAVKTSDSPNSVNEKYILDQSKDERDDNATSRNRDSNSDEKTTGVKREPEDSKELCESHNEPEKVDDCKIKRSPDDQKSKCKNVSDSNEDKDKSEQKSASVSEPSAKEETSKGNSKTSCDNGDSTDSVATKTDDSSVIKEESKDADSKKCPAESISAVIVPVKTPCDDGGENVSLSSSSVSPSPKAAASEHSSAHHSSSDKAEVLVQSVIQQNTLNTRLRSGKETSKVLSPEAKKNGQAASDNDKASAAKQKPSSLNLRRAPLSRKEGNGVTKEQRSPLSSKTAAKKEISPMKEKQREEDEKLRECLFSTGGSPRGSLSGYRIPKKARTDSGATGDSGETKKGGLTPLHEVSQPTVEYPENSYARTRYTKGWSKESEQSAYAVNGENQDQSTRLVIKLRKVPNYSTSQQWQRESDFPETPNTFKVVQNDWHSQAKRSERILRSDRRFLSPADPQSHPPLPPPDPQTKENGSRYSRRFRGMPPQQKLSKSDIAYS